MVPHCCQLLYYCSLERGRENRRAGFRILCLDFAGFRILLSISPDFGFCLDSTPSIQATQ